MEESEPSVRYSVQTLNRVTLDYEPCCLEFWDTTHFVVGYYHLDKQDEDNEEHGKAQVRSGAIDIMKIIGSEGDIQYLERVAFNTSSVLDLHFQESSNRVEGSDPILVAALSTGSLVSYKLRQTTKSSTETRFQEQTFHQVAPPTILVTAFQFHTDPNIICAALSTGEIILCVLDLSSPAISPESEPRSVDYRDTEKLMTICNHDLEAWYVVPSIDGISVLSGGDDATFRVSDCSGFLAAHSDGDKFSVGAPVQRVDRRIHQAGVTVIYPLSKSIMLTGSYDDHIRAVSVPSVGRPTVLTELDLGGGVWRLQELSRTQHRPMDASNDRVSWVVLVSCMYAGVRVVEIKLENDIWSIDVLARFEEHKSMNYASAAIPSADGHLWKEEGGAEFVSTSFYDKLLCVWRTGPQDGNRCATISATGT
ncbi:hypothetical protein P152DRAFT_483620 [Eremomyces bilateralis CBS 781.70]|uniref:WD40 repeat-like protein n=1 Tax=Eremomyces bilateralis CBS 781.70 TaxID=1392243 RepID=A0A6G1FYX5_9PEZI|nr:uncharacterized protein P152DRAFT_483620 [Eremomyces bilateralis CBS 781.70]KAF1810922.1 hypothetical protein P152DRAFT_483620 [Eremomyces bilateralis CBS 781.70]